jgi:hypothetical protein
VTAYLAEVAGAIRTGVEPRIDGRRDREALARCYAEVLARLREPTGRGAERPA